MLFSPLHNLRRQPKVDESGAKGEVPMLSESQDEHCGRDETTGLSQTSPECRAWAVLHPSTHFRPSPLYHSCPGTITSHVGYHNPLLTGLPASTFTALL